MSGEAGQHHARKRFEGPIAWAAALIVGVVIGAGATRVLKAEYVSHAEVRAADGKETSGLESTKKEDPHPALPRGERGNAAEENPPPDPLPVGGGEKEETGTGTEKGTGPPQPLPPGGVRSQSAVLGPVIPLWLCVPFVVLLGCIALMPFINQHFWHHHFPDISFFLGGLVAGYYFFGFSQPGYAGGKSFGLYSLLHSGLEYYSFIALVGGLYVVSGSILIELRGKPTAWYNTVLLGFGAVLANVVGTTGASMLLIRPFLRVNEGRIRAMHIVFFIFIVSNCGGALTPIGDPPLYLGYLKGVPFDWTMYNLVGEWAFVVGLLLVVFYLYDHFVVKEAGPHSRGQEAGYGFSVRGTRGLMCLALMIAGVFVDPMLKKYWSIEGYPVGATCQLIVAAFAYFTAPRDILAANHFNFFPVKEVGLLFAGIFITMIPALGYLSENGARLGVDSPTAFYFATGSLSAVLDNAPTYLNFLQIAFGPQEINAATMAAWLTTHEHVLDLRAISTGAVFFGAMTYIGNGPNFMVKAIAEASLIKMPSFFGYLGRALAILFPVLVLNWWVFFVVLR